MHNVNNIESNVFEVLSEVRNANEFSIACYDVLEDAIDELLQGVFRKDDYAMKYAVAPLLDSNGPLQQLDIRLKLLFGLGLLSQQIYDDVEKFVLLKSVVQDCGMLLEFRAPEFVACLKEISAVTDIMALTFDINSMDMSDTALYQLQVNRQNQQIHSALMLAVTEIVKALHRKTPLNS